MAKPKISISSFRIEPEAEPTPAPDKSISEEDVFSGLDDDANSDKQSSVTDRYLKNISKPRQSWKKEESRSDPKTLKAAKVGRKLRTTKTDDDILAFVDTKMSQEIALNTSHEENQRDFEDAANEESSTESHEDSTLVSADTRSTFDEIPELPKVPVMCSDNLVLVQATVTEFCKQTGASLEEMNTFLTNELEVSHLANDVSALHKASLENLSQVDVAELFAKFTESNGSTSEVLSPIEPEETAAKDKPDETTAANAVDLIPKGEVNSIQENREICSTSFTTAIVMESSSQNKSEMQALQLFEPAWPYSLHEHEDERKEDTTLDMAISKSKGHDETSKILNCISVAIEDVAKGESMEVPLFSCDGGCDITKPAKKKRGDFLLRIFPGGGSDSGSGGSWQQIKDTTDAFEAKQPYMAEAPVVTVMQVQTVPVNTHTQARDLDDVISGMPGQSMKPTRLVKPGVLRVQLDDGDMVSVCKEMADKLHSCEWV